MLVKTLGVVLNFVKFRESSIIARLYTEQLGLQSYIINSIRAKGPASRMALFQPFTLLDLVVYDTRKGGINRIKEYKVHYHFRTIPYDIRKSSILIFLSEVVTRSVREEEANPQLFHFLHNSIIRFDELETGVEDFHLHFLLQFAHFLGFGPSSGSDITDQVSEARLTLDYSQDLQYHPQEYRELFDRLLQDEPEPLPVSGRIRRDLLLVLTIYYRLHVDKLGEIKSLKVLSEVLAE